MGSWLRTFRDEAWGCRHLRHCRKSARGLPFATRSGKSSRKPPCRQFPTNCPDMRLAPAKGSKQRQITSAGFLEYMQPFIYPVDPIVVNSNAKALGNISGSSRRTTDFEFYSRNPNTETRSLATEQIPAEKQTR